MQIFSQADPEIRYTKVQQVGLEFVGHQAKPVELGGQDQTIKELRKDAGRRQKWENEAEQERVGIRVKGIR